MTKSDLQKEEFILADGSRRRNQETEIETLTKTAGKNLFVFIQQALLQTVAVGILKQKDLPATVTEIDSEEIVVERGSSDKNAPALSDDVAQAKGWLIHTQTNKARSTVLPRQGTGTTGATGEGQNQFCHLPQVVFSFQDSISSLCPMERNAMFLHGRKDVLSSVKPFDKDNDPIDEDGALLG
ncbi:hypothetical protein STEG23_018370 [Scotinomys teguina]